MNYAYLDQAIRLTKGQVQGPAAPHDGKEPRPGLAAAAPHADLRARSRPGHLVAQYRSRPSSAKRHRRESPRFSRPSKDLLFGLSVAILVPAILATMALVIANAISISVRERRREMAVLKVLGFARSQILILVLGEALLIGVAATHWPLLTWRSTTGWGESSFRSLFSALFTFPSTPCGGAWRYAPARCWEALFPPGGPERESFGSVRESGLRPRPTVAALWLLNRPIELSEHAPIAFSQHW